MPLYEPREDSELLKKAVVAHALGAVLDMGTGSGIQAFAAAAKEEVKSVLAVDIDEESLGFVTEELEKKEKAVQEKIKIQNSNLFTSVKGGFDTIIFNPPYLPDEENDEHQALYGGKEGYELAVTFLQDAKQHLKKNGSILLLFSSLTNKERVDQELKKEGYHSEQLLMEAHFFERLYVYRIWRLPDDESATESTPPRRDRVIPFPGFCHLGPARVSRGPWQKSYITESTAASTHDDQENSDEYFAKGKRGQVFLRENDGKRVLVKVKHPDSVVDTIRQEARFTKKLNEHGIGPRFISYDGHEMVREYIEGEELRKWLPTAEKEKIRHVFLVILEQCKTMDDLGINKLEMNHPWKHILVQANGEPVLIDFERCKETLLPKNLTQFCQFMTGTNITKACREKGLVLDNEKILELAKIYKHNIKNNEQKLNTELYTSLVDVVRSG